MGFFKSASPGVDVNEIDLSTVVPQVQSTIGAAAGVFRWGPVGKLTLVDTEDTLVKRYGKPTNFNAETFFNAANFLAYGGAAYISRAANTTDATGANGALSAYANDASVSAANNLMTVKNTDDYVLKAPSFDAGVRYIAKYPGVIGNSLKVSVCDSATEYTSNLAVSNALFAIGSNTATFQYSNNSVAVTGAALITLGDVVKAGNSTIGFQFMKITSISGPGVSSSNIAVQFEKVFQLSTAWNTVTSVPRYWEYFNIVQTPPGQSDYVKNFGNSAAQDTLHLVVSDQDGLFTGVPGQVLEVWENMSRATDGKTQDGSSNYYKNVINGGSNYLWWAGDRTSALSNTALNVVSGSGTNPLTLSLIAGADGPDETAVKMGDLTNAFDLFKSSEDVDVSLIMTGKNRALTENTSDPTTYVQLANYISDNITDSRKDAVVFVSAPKSTVVNNVGGTIPEDVAAFANALRSSSYMFIDSGYKYQYDKYNDIYRWVPMNGDIAGLAARTDALRDPWWSFAGFNRGQIKNLIKLAFNPSHRADRDTLYKAGVNPVVSFPGQGTILFGDKTHLGNSGSAFSRINVRRLFIVMEKAIALMARFDLFEFNDIFTQAQFRNTVEPYLRDIQGKRGIFSFKVVCDGTNNTPDVVDNEQFVGDIYVKPARAINNIQLNFVAVRDGVTFEEIVGRF